MPSPQLSFSRRRWPVWLGAAAPVVFFVWLAYAHEIPRAVLAESIDLRGEWKVLEGNPAGAALPSLDDGAAPTMRVPGGYEEQGFRGTEAWLRRRFTLRPGMEKEWLFLMFGDTRGAPADIYLNGEWIGESGRTVLGTKTDLSGRLGFPLPVRYLVPGENLLAMHFQWEVEREQGIRDSAVLIGPQRSLGLHYLRTSDLRELVQNGAGVLMLFLVVLFGSLSVAEWSTPNRSLYLSCIGLLAAAILYVSILSGVFFSMSATEAWSQPVIYSLILLVGLTQADFLSRYYLGARSRFRTFNAIATAAIIAATWGTLVLGLDRWIPATFIAGRVYLLVPVTYTAVLGLVSLVRRARQLDPVLASGILISATTGGTDLLKGLGILPGPYLYVLGISACSIMAAVVLIVDFTRISFDNKELSTSLQQSNSELGEALVKAQEASRIKSEFVANVSHELRTPLNSVINIPEALLETIRPVKAARCAACAGEFELEEGDLVDARTACPGCGKKGTLTPGEQLQFQGEPAVVQKNLRQIHRSGKQLLRLIDDVLDFSKLEAGKMQLRLEPLVPERYLSEVVETLEPLARPRKIRLQLDAGDGPPLHADEGKLRQVMVNLMGNAIKFSSEGSEVRIEAKFLPDEQLWRLSVHDRGIGIAAQHHETIFESFRQVDGSDTRRFGGTGLGLAITRKLVDAHGGRISLESAAGKGSTFHVFLPLNPANSLDSAAEPAAS